MGKLEQSGFGYIEILLLFVVAFIIGGTGYYVYQSQNNTKQTFQKTGSFKNTANLSKTTPSVAPTNSTKAGKQAVRYLEIKEWGIKLPLSNDLPTLTYSIDGNGNANHPQFSVRTKELADASGKCYSNALPVVRGKANEKVPNEAGENGFTFVEVYNQEKGITKDNLRALKAHVGEYYYVVAHYGGASCASGRGDSIDKLELAEPQYSIANAIQNLETL